MAFFAGMPLPVQFFLAFVIVVGLIGVTAWAAGALRGRQPRLGVIDYATVDRRRRLILVRRDNVEHLVMIGGPTDVVVESYIARGAPAAPRARQPSSSPRGHTPANIRPQPLEPRPNARQTQPCQEPQPAATQSAESLPSTDQVFAEMAHQLAALRKPIASAERNKAREPRPAAMPRAEPFGRS